MEHLKEVLLITLGSIFTLTGTILLVGSIAMFARWLYI